MKRPTNRQPYRGLGWLGRQLALLTSDKSVIQLCTIRGRRCKVKLVVSPGGCVRFCLTDRREPKLFDEPAALIAWAHRLVEIHFNEIENRNILSRSGVRQ